MLRVDIKGDNADALDAIKFNVRQMRLTVFAVHRPSRLNLAIHLLVKLPDEEIYPPVKVKNSTCVFC